MLAFRPFLELSGLDCWNRPWDGKSGPLYTKSLVKVPKAGEKRTEMLALLHLNDFPARFSVYRIVYAHKMASE